jgi:leucyl-tRNA synthetase
MVKNASKEVGNGDVVGLSKLKNKIAYDVENLKFNTVVSSLMEFFNKNEKANWTEKSVEQFLILISPFTPYLAEELWESLGKAGSVHAQSLEIQEESGQGVEIVEIPVMVNGKVRARLSVSINEQEQKVVDVAMTITEIKKFLPDGHKKVVYVPGKAVNFVG